MPRQIKQCAWEIYLKNIFHIYKNTAFYFGIRFFVAFLIGQLTLHPFLRQIIGIVWTLSLVPMDLWWRKSLVDLIKEEKLLPKNIFSFYQNNSFCQKGLFAQVLCEGGALWFWGIGSGLRAGEGAANFFGVGFEFLGLTVPFLFALLIQPFYVSILVSPQKTLSSALSLSWKAMKGKRKDLLSLWASLIPWLLLLLLSGILTDISHLWLTSLLSYGIMLLACVSILPYVILCGIFFSLRILKF